MPTERTGVGRWKGDGEWEWEGPGGACSIAHSSSARSSCRLASSSYAPINSACFFTCRNATSVGHAKARTTAKDCDAKALTKRRRFGLARPPARLGCSFYQAWHAAAVPRCLFLLPAPLVRLLLPFEPRQLRAVHGLCFHVLRLCSLCRLRTQR